MITLLIVTVAALVYGFAGTTTGIVMNKRLYDRTNLDRGDSRAWSVVFGLLWPLVLPSTWVWGLSVRTVAALEARQQNKLLPEAKVKS